MYKKGKSGRSQMGVGSVCGQEDSHLHDKERSQHRSFPTQLNPTNTFILNFPKTASKTVRKASTVYTAQSMTPVTSTYQCTSFLGEPKLRMGGLVYSVTTQEGWNKEPCVGKASLLRSCPQTISPSH